MVTATQETIKSTDQVIDRAARILGSPQSVLGFQIAGSQEPTLVRELAIRLGPIFKECKSPGMPYPSDNTPSATAARDEADSKANRLAAMYGAPLGSTPMIQRGEDRVPSPFPGLGMNVTAEEVRAALVKGDRLLPVTYPVFTYDAGAGLKRVMVIGSQIEVMSASALVVRYNRLKAKLADINDKAGIPDATKAELISQLQGEMEVALNALISLDVLAWADTRSAPAKQFLNFLDWLTEEGRANNGIYLLLDPESVTKGAGAYSEIQRRIKNAAQTMAANSYKKLILCGTTETLPAEYSTFIHTLKIEVPEQEELRHLVEGCLAGLKATVEDRNNKVPEDRQREWIDELGDEGVSALVKAAQGLTSEQVQNILREGVLGKIVGRPGAPVVLDDSLIDAVQSAKIDQLKRLGVEFANAPDVEVGGLHNLKAWAEQRRKMFWLVEDKSSAAYQAIAHLKPKAPRGALITGISGTGKSLIAKSIGKDWGVPILTLDIGTLFGSYVGESEERTRTLIKAVEACAPCVLYIDEIDKALASAGQTSKGDSGVSDRMLGTLLTWMQEKTSNVFVIASANDMAMIQETHPEFLRKGRFDEKFFVDLPTVDERKEVFAAHLRGKGEFSDADLVTLAEASDGFVGAEIGAAVSDSVYRAINAERTELIVEDILAELATVRPLSKADPNMVARLRDWGHRHATPAGRQVLRDNAKTSQHPEMNGATRESGGGAMI